MMKLKCQFNKDAKSLSLILILKKQYNYNRDLSRDEESDVNVHQNQLHDEKSQKDWFNILM
ncbi:hypothetical protein PGB90_007910 [Kerria lacca]